MRQRNFERLESLLIAPQGGKRLSEAEVRLAPAERPRPLRISQRRAEPAELEVGDATVAEDGSQRRVFARALQHIDRLRVEQQRGGVFACRKVLVPLRLERLNSVH